MTRSIVSAISSSHSEQIGVFKAICAAMVVSIHVPIQTSLIGEHSLYGQWLAVWHEGVARLAVPSFFMLSGYFVARHLPDLTLRSYGVLLLKKAKTLLVPYVTMNLAFWMLAALSGVFAAQVSGGGKDMVWGLRQIVEAIGLPGVSQPINFALWFLRCLMYFMVLLPVVGCIVLQGRKWAIALVAGVFAASQLIFTHSFETGGVNWQTGFDIYGFCWFITGIAFRIYPVRITLKTVSLMPLAIIVVAVFGLLCFRFGSNWTPVVIWKYSMMIPVCAYVIWRASTAIRIPTVVKQNTMPIYCLQVPLFFVFGVVAAKLHFNLAGTGVAGYCVMAVAVTLICAFVAEGVRRYFPRLSAICFGGR